MITAGEKKGILAAVVRIMVELLFSTHLYTFVGRCSSKRMAALLG